jgi:CheY-like chemotaxis protein
MSRTPLVLIADDNEEVVASHAAILEEAGFRVATARDGEEAIAQALALRPDAILMDLSMPVLDGWEATRRIRADLRTHRIPIIAFTAYGLRRYLDRSFAAGCRAFVEKSCREPRRLIDEVRRAIADTPLYGALSQHDDDVGSEPHQR